MKTFDGNQFLVDHTCEIKLSNGKTYVVKDITETQAKKIQSIEDSTLLIVVLGEIFGEPVDGIGIGEAKSVLDFLFENLLGVK